MTHFRLFIRGEEYPYKTVQLNFNNDQKDWSGYYRFLEARGCLTKRKPNMVKPEAWGQHFERCSRYLNYRLSGDAIYRIYVGTGGLPEPVTVISYGEFENMLEVDSNQAVLYDIVHGRQL